MRDGKPMIDTNKLIEEHKSGISKAIKIVKYDLGNENNFIRVVTDDPDKFIIEAAINIENLIRNETYTNS
jgi:Na+-translocating ferredoxin:NAD+ oxidoreductase RnfC subunit